MRLDQFALQKSNHSFRAALIRAARPAASAQDMAMQMRHRLAAIPAVVDHHAVAAFCPAPIAGPPRRPGAADGRAAFHPPPRPRTGAGCFLGNDQDMRWRLGIDVAERQHRFILKHDVGRNFARDDFLEYILAHKRDPPVPPGHWPGGIRRTINVEKTRLMAGCCFTFRSASRGTGGSPVPPPNSATGMKYPG
jgi:hypothetical protein